MCLHEWLQSSARIILNAGADAEKLGHSGTAQRMLQRPSYPAEEATASPRPRGQHTAQQLPS